MSETQANTRKLENLFFVLAGLFITNALIAEIIGVKVFSVERLMGLAGDAGTGGKESAFRLNMSVGVLIWPIVFVLSDIINEYFGRRGVRKVSLLGAGLIAYAFIVIYVSTRLPASPLWLDANNTDPAGKLFDIDYAYTYILSQGLGIIIGSLTAFLVSQLVDAYTFYYLRRLTEHRNLWLRATGSTVVSQLIDSFLVLFIAFYLLGNYSFRDVLSIGIVQYLYKVSLAILLTPVIYLMHFIIDRYLGVTKARTVVTTVDT